MDYWWVIIVGIIGGAAVGVQSPIAGTMGARVGGTASSFIIHLSGAILSALLLVARGGEGIRDWRSLPWYMLGAGVFGLILYQTINVTLPRVGSTMMIALILVIGLLSISFLVIAGAAYASNNIQEFTSVFAVVFAALSTLTGTAVAYYFTDKSKQ